MELLNNVNSVIINYERDSLLTDYARDMVLDFYAIDGEKSPQDCFARAAFAWSKFKGVTDHALAQRLYDAVSQKWFMFASPVLSNAPDANGKSRGLPISCFLGYVPDTLEGLIEHTSELRWLSVMGGGVGGHWSDVRSVTDMAPGPIPFIHTVDGDMTAYKQGSTRKGSYAAYLDVDHPDILEFIQLRVPTGDSNRKALNIHNAVNITDKFMEACIAGKDYELVDPKRGGTGEFLNARKVFEKIIEIRFRTGEPYMNFIDTANRYLPEVQKALGLRIHGSNLCDEIHLATDEERTAVCCLSSPNMALYHEWRHTTLIADLVRMLDNVLEYFIENAPSTLWRATNSARSERAIGIGTMGFHSYLQSQNIPWESEKARDLNIRYFEENRGLALAESYRLAIERGEPSDMKGTGLRNSHLFAIAPNASSGVIVSVSPSIESNKANAYTHRTRSGSFLVTSPHLKEVLSMYGEDNEATWASIITNGGSVQHLSFLSPQYKEVYKTSFEIDQMWTIQHAADRQPYICQGQSVNVFFPPGTSRSVVLNVHLAAWREGLKGLYYLRTESKQRAENISKAVELDKLEDDDKTIVYGKDNCNFCTMVKALLDSRDIEYDYIDVPSSGKSASELTGQPGVRSLPQVFIDGEYIGGYKETYEFLTQDDDEVSDEECQACSG